MTTIRELIGYMIDAGDPDLQVAEQLYVMCKEWPPYESARTPRERVIADLVSGGLDAVLLAIGVFGHGDDDDHWIGVSPPESAEQVAARQMLGQVAATNLQLARTVAAQHDLDDPQFRLDTRQAAQLASGRIGNAAGFLDVVVGADDDTPESHWWEVLGLDRENLP